jgi:hypothetical protein
LYQYIFNKRIVQTFEQTEGHGVEGATSPVMMTAVPPLAAAVQIA